MELREPQRVNDEEQHQLVTSAEQQGSQLSHPFEIFQNDPNFQTIKDLMCTSPRENIENLIEQFRRTNPRLYAAIRADKEGFLRLFGYNIDYENDRNEFPTNRFVPGVFHFTQDEYDDIKSLMKLGYSESACVSAYDIADRNLQAAANLLASESD